jgi:nucleoside-diphosphate-sugar epimerase
MQSTGQRPCRRILIAGCGRIGTRLGVQLAEDGDAVFGLRRHPEELPDAITPCAADLTRESNLADRLPAALDCVYVILTPGQYNDDGYRRTYVEGLTNLYDALGASGNKDARLIFVSSTGVYGENAGGWVDETTPPRPTRFSGIRLLEAESVAGNHPGGCVIIRFAGIYGPGRDALVRRVAAGAACQADPARYTNRIHEDDCVGFLRHVGRMDQPAACYIGVDDRPCTQCEIMDWLATALDLPRPMREAGGPAGRRCHNARLRASGYRLRYPDYRSGYPSLLAERRSSV